MGDLQSEGAMQMAKAMTKSQILKALAEKTGMTKKDVANFMEVMVSMAYKEARNGFTIPGLGKLVLVHRKARMGRNPQTQEPIQIPAKKVLRFRIAKAAKDAVL
jgi:DNA-binding protein HU-beta